MALKTFTKDPDETIMRGFRWGKYLRGARITASVWDIESGLTQASPAPTFDDTTTTIYLSGGTAGQDYTVENQVTTSEGEIVARSFIVAVRED